MTSSNGNIFRVTGLLWGESTGHRWIPLTTASDAELWRYLGSAPEQTVEQTNKRVACVLKRHRAHYDVTVTIFSLFPKCDDNYKNRVKLENHCYDRNDTDGVSGLYKVSEHPSCCRISAPVRWRLSFSATCSENLWLTRTCLTPR